MHSFTDVRSEMHLNDYVVTYLRQMFNCTALWSTVVFKCALLINLNWIGKKTVINLKEHNALNQQSDLYFTSLVQKD